MRNVPFVLAENVGAFAANIGGSQSPLKIRVRDAKEKIRVRIAGAETSALIGVEIEFAVGVVIVDQILLVGRKTGAEFPVVLSSRPSDCIGPRKCVFHLSRGAGFAGTE